MVCSSPAPTPRRCCSARRRLAPAKSQYAQLWEPAAGESCSNWSPKACCWRSSRALRDCCSPIWDRRRWSLWLRPICRGCRNRRRSIGAGVHSRRLDHEPPVRSGSSALRIEARRQRGVEAGRNAIRDRRRNGPHAGSAGSRGGGDGSSASLRSGSAHQELSGIEYRRLGFRPENVLVIRATVPVPIQEEARADSSTIRSLKSAIFPAYCQLARRWPARTRRVVGSYFLDHLPAQPDWPSAPRSRSTSWLRAHSQHGNAPDKRTRLQQRRYSRQAPCRRRQSGAGSQIVSRREPYRQNDLLSVRHLKGHDDHRCCRGVRQLARPGNPYRSAT